VVQHGQVLGVPVLQVGGHPLLAAGLEEVRLHGVGLQLLQHGAIAGVQPLESVDVLDVEGGMSSGRIGVEPHDHGAEIQSVGDDVEHMLCRVLRAKHAKSVAKVNKTNKLGPKWVPTKIA